MLRQALYAYSPDYHRAVRLDADVLARTLAVVRRHKGRGRDFAGGRQQSYLSAYFNRLVLDNLALSESKIGELEKLF